MAKSYLEEIYYKINSSKNYFGLAFKNNSGGYEVRNKYFKGSFGKKDITLIKNGSDTLKIFEGFMDFLSYIEIKGKNPLKSDYMVLNSLSLLDRGIDVMEKGGYGMLESYLDNDEAGDKATSKLTSIGAIDKRGAYENFKDLNASWTTNQEEKIITRRLRRKYPTIENVTIEYVETLSPLPKPKYYDSNFKDIDTSLILEFYYRLKNIPKQKEFVNAMKKELIARGENIA